MNLLTLLPPFWIIPVCSDNAIASLVALGPKSLSLIPREMSHSMCRVQGDLDVLFILRKKTTGIQGKLLAIFLQKGAS